MPYRNINFWRIPNLVKGYYQLQILNFVIEHIEIGSLPVNAALPAYREIAKINDLHRNTVQRALNKLENMGYLASRRGAVIYVSPTYPGHDELAQMRLVTKLPIPLPNLDPTPTKFADSSHDFLSIGFAIPCPSFFPYKLYSKYFKRLVANFGCETQRQILIDLQGMEYKNAILDYINVIRSFRLFADSMDVVMGRRNSLYAVFKTILDAGDVIVNTSPKDTLLNNVLKSAGIKSISLNTIDEDFIALFKECLESQSVKALYVKPQCAYPEGGHLSGEVCKKLIDLAEKYSFYIVEEEEEHEFWYEDEPFDPLFCHNHKGHVLYLGPLSMVTPYMNNTRIVAGQAEFIERVKSVSIVPFESRDLLEEKIIIEMLRSGDFFKHLKAVRKTIKEKHFD